GSSEMGLGNLGGPGEGVANRLAGLKANNPQRQETRASQATANDAPVQDPGATETVGKLMTWHAGRYRQCEWIDEPCAGEKGLALYLLQLASSTIQETRSSKLCPTWAACSGASEVGVMPGWVLISRQTSSPSSPAASL